MPSTPPENTHKPKAEYHVIREEPLQHLPEYAQIPIAFRVESILRVHDDPQTGRIMLNEAVQQQPYIKDYGAIPANHPTDWANRLNLSRWGLIGAWQANRRVGGAVIARLPEGMTLAEQRSDLAVLWDLRVAPRQRGVGIGAALVAAAEQWARSRRCSEIKVETQNINVRACRVYERQGFKLRAANRRAYPQFPDEVQPLWYKTIG